MKKKIFVCYCLVLCGYFAYSQENASAIFFIDQINKSFIEKTNFAGVPNLILKDFNYCIGSDFELEITPNATITKQGNNYMVNFHNIGVYNLKFTDKHNGPVKQILEKSVQVIRLPAPMAKLGNHNLAKDSITLKSLLTSYKLEGDLGINYLASFPGRINGFRIIQITKEQTKSIYNYGDAFGNEAKTLINSLQKGDRVMFDNIICSLEDGTTRSTNILSFKIVE